MADRDTGSDSLAYSALDTLPPPLAATLLHLTATDGGSQCRADGSGTGTHRRLLG